MQKLNPQTVYDLLKTIPKGKVTTYKALGKILHTKAYRYIGQILGKNPHAPIVPCHRVIKSDGTLGGYNRSKNQKELAKKILLLQQEGVTFEKGKVKPEFILTKFPPA